MYELVNDVHAQVTKLNESGRIQFWYLFISFKEFTSLTCHSRIETFELQI